MRKLILAVALSLPLVAVAGPFGGGHMGGDPDRMLDRMSKELELTDDQRGKIENIFTQHREKMMKLRDETQTQVDAVLTPAQREKMAEMRAKREAKMEEKKKERMDGKDKPAKKSD